ncbi:hypothetical protein GGR57DRAFT_275927 [Xylariaceae sp. FL1272]|nr:hypothetical protein GGR57DRAFT_275927 [Xylariaceae sp. FL1272]
MFRRSRQTRLNLPNTIPRSWSTMDRCFEPLALRQVRLWCLRPGWRIPLSMRTAPGDSFSSIPDASDCGTTVKRPACHHRRFWLRPNKLRPDSRGLSLNDGPMFRATGLKSSSPKNPDAWLANEEEDETMLKTSFLLDVLGFDSIAHCVVNHHLGSRPTSRHCARLCSDKKLSICYLPSCPSLLVAIPTLLRPSVFHPRFPDHTHTRTRSL